MQKFTVYKSATKIDTIWAYSASEAAKAYGLSSPTIIDGAAFQWFTEESSSYAIEIISDVEDCYA